MGKLSVTITDVAGETRTFDDIDEGRTLMEASKQHGVEGVLATCGGGAACGTCHVYVDDAWLGKLVAPDSIEADMLDLLEDTRRANSRLGCQIKLTPALDGLTVTVAQPSEY